MVVHRFDKGGGHLVFGAHHADTDHANPDGHGVATAMGCSPRSTAAALNTATWMVSAIARSVKPIRWGVSTVLGWSNTG